MTAIARLAPLAALAAAALAAPAHASDEDFELWFNPSVSTDLDDNTGLELETAQRLRDGSRGRADTYYARLWLNQSIGDAATLSLGVERRVNDGGADETRLHQQISLSSGIFRARGRLEQRFVDESGRMGLRLRGRGGVSVPLDAQDRWSANASIETFWTLRSTGAGGQDGLTGMRAQAGIDYAVSDSLTLGLAYLRNQDFRDGAPDTVGHAPLIGIEFSF